MEVRSGVAAAVAAAVAASVVAADILSFHFLFRLAFYSFLCFICTPGNLHMYTKKKPRPVVAVPHMCPQTILYTCPHTICLSAYCYR